MDLADIVMLVGAVLAIGGVALVHLPSAVILTGVLLFAFAMLVAGKRRGP
jgi:hypothetical protein